MASSSMAWMTSALNFRPSPTAFAFRMRTTRDKGPAASRDIPVIFATPPDVSVGRGAATVPFVQQ